MYMKLLEQTIKELKGEEIEDDIRANVNLRVDLRIDETYIPDMNQRLTVYRRMAAVRSEAELQRTMEETRDRYGAPPASVRTAEYAFIAARRPDRHRIIDREAQIVV
jgi:transcription-repair coupling factor (superfamily II helicase)